LPSQKRRTKLLSYCNKNTLRCCNKSGAKKTEKKMRVEIREKKRRKEQVNKKEKRKKKKK